LEDEPDRRAGLALKAMGAVMSRMGFEYFPSSSNLGTVFDTRSCFGRLSTGSENPVPEQIE